MHAYGPRGGGWGGRGRGRQEQGGSSVGGEGGAARGRGGMSSGRGGRGRGRGFGDWAPGSPPRGRGGGSGVGRGNGQSFEPPRPRKGDNPLKSFFHRVLCYQGPVSEVMKDGRDAERFLSAMECYEEKQDLLYQLDDRNLQGHEALRVAYALAFGGQDDRLLDSAVRFLGVLGSKNLSKGTMRGCVKECFSEIFRVPGLLRAISEALDAGRVQDMTAIAWFLVSVLTGGSTEAAEARHNQTVLKIFEMLQKKASAVADGGLIHLANLLSANTLAEEEGVESLEDVRAIQAPPGNRHDNDSADYRRIGIVPTSDEMNCEQGAFLPVSFERSDAKVLERNFRLLREDMVATFKEQLCTSKDDKDQRGVFKFPRLMEIETNPSPCIVISVSMPHGLRKRYTSLNAKQKKEFFDTSARRVLAKDSLVALITHDWQVIAVGRVVVRDLSWIVHEVPPHEGRPAEKLLQVGITFHGADLSAMWSLLTGQGTRRGGTFIPGAAALYQSPVSLFSYEPVLKNLRDMTSIPLIEELVHGRPVELTGLAHAGLKLSDLDEQTRKEIESDPTQVEALELAMKQRVALIQGPPGTGKTWLGRIYAQVALTAPKLITPDGQIPPPTPRILVMCFTNHALDSFLEALLDAGLKSEGIVRLGGSQKISQRLKSRCLNEILKNNSSQFNRLQKRRFAMLKQSKDDSERLIKQYREKLSKSVWGVQWWRTVAEFLQNGDSDHFAAYEQLCVDDEILGLDAYGMHIVGKKGKAIAEDALWQSWFKGEQVPTFLTGGRRGPQKKKGKQHEAPPPRPINSRFTAGIWLLNKDARRKLVSDWCSESLHPIIERMERAMREIVRANEELEELRKETHVPIIQAAQVIGCTTTAAAKHSDLLRDSDISIVLVEEAAEILEAHIITALNSNVKQLVMIGDHQQLRPKLENYKLRVESGDGINFDKSLFERLATEEKDIPRACLQIQHRMRPEISKFVRKTMYPLLEDHPKTLTRAHVRGIAGDVLFITHDHEEAGEEDKAGLGGTMSKINMHEVQMAVALTNYLLQQGYRHDQIVILTPYLGQLVQVRDLLAEQQLDADIGDLDKGDLIKNQVDLLGLDSKKPSVRCATIDNYQGEEADIVIATLVRSNQAGVIGFLSGAERVNVLLSRARIGMYLIGNASTFVNAKTQRGRDLWRNVLEDMAVVKGLPAVCANHKTVQELSCAADFRALASDGGCQLPCGVPLPSCPHGHPCPKRCHPLGERGHADALCMHEMPEKCVAGHAVRRLCFSAEPEACGVRVQDDCPKGHYRVRKCSQPPLTVCESCDRAEERRRQAEDRALQAAEVMVKRRKVADERLLDAQEKMLAEEAVSAAEAVVHRQEKEARLLEVRAEILRENRAKARQQSEEEIEEAVAAQLKLLRAQEGEEGGGEGSLPQRDRFARGKCAHSEHVREGVAKHRKHAQRDEMDVDEEGTDTVIINLSGPPSSPLAPPKELLSKAQRKKCESMDAPDGDGEASVVMSDASADSNTDGGCADRHISRLGGRVGFNGGFKDLSKAVQLLSKGKYTPAYEAAEAVVKKHHPDGHACAEALRLLCALKLGEKASDLLAGDDGMHCLLQRFPVKGADEQSAGLLLYVTAELKVSSGLADADASLYAQSFLALPCIEGMPQEWIKSAKKIASKVGSSKSIAGAGKKSTAEPTVEQEWDEVKQRMLAQHKSSPHKGKDTEQKEAYPEALDELMRMTGLGSVKRAFLNELYRMQIAEEQGMSPDKGIYNARFDGNPGVGKTTVARIYGRFLEQLGILPKDAEVLETTGAKLSAGGTTELDALLKKCEEKKGGVIFVDEAYSMEPKTDRNGRQVLDAILPHAEKLKGECGRVVFIFAGYQKKMDALFEHNEGLSSRFPRHFKFEDYTFDELHKIFQSLCANPNGRPQTPVAPEKPLQSVKVQTPKAQPVNNPSYGYAFGYGGRPVPANQPAQVTTESDSWGNTWTYSPTQYTWSDSSLDNECGFGPANPQHPLGSASNPVFNTKGGVKTEWLYDNRRQVWYSKLDPKHTRQRFPGVPEPQKQASQTLSFTLSNAKYGRIAVRRIAMMRGVVGFGNARAIHNLFDIALRRQAQRLTLEKRAGRNPDICMFERDDLLGLRADAEKMGECEALRKLEGMEGLHEVKEELHRFLSLVVKNAEREEKELPPLEVNLNRVFLGNPGTGKTTVAKLYAQILCDFGLVSKGELIVKNASDFVGDVLGASETKTREILRSAEGCVLVIDEAYSLNPSMGGKGSKCPYKTAVCDTIVEMVQGGPGVDRAVIMLGYRQEMERMLQDANPGLARRFALDSAFVFADYDDDSLVKILRSKAQASNLKIDTKTAIAAIKQLAKARAQGNFGNAGAVENLISQAKIKMAAQNRDALEMGDFVPEDNECVGNEEQIFSGLLGCDAVLDKLRELRSAIMFSRRQGNDQMTGIEFNYRFTGAPGTGKTTIARRMGRMFKSLGILPTEDVVEVSASDFVTGYTNQSGGKCADMLKKAKGKVLFIDEAYQLNPKKGGPYMQEVVDEIVKQLTSEDLKDKIVVILAGYESDIDEMLNVNQGLRSRFSEKIKFENLSAPVAAQMLEHKLRTDSDLSLSSEARSLLPSLAEKLVGAPNFANGRDIDNWSKRTYKQVAIRSTSRANGDDDDDENATLVVPSDLTKALDSLLESKRESKREKSTTEPVVEMPQMSASQFDFAPPPPATAVAKASITMLEDDDDEPAGGSEDRRVQALQSVIDSFGLNSQEGCKDLSEMDPTGERMQEIARALANKLDISVGEAITILRDWQKQHKDLQEKLEEIEKEKASGKQTLVPIWRCGVCGRADMPYIACWVAPYILRYDPVDA